MARQGRNVPVPGPGQVRLVPRQAGWLILLLLGQVGKACPVVEPGVG